MKTDLPRQQKGAVAIEFALVPNLPVPLTARSSLQF
jgi:hypothetical protein